MSASLDFAVDLARHTGLVLLDHFQKAGLKTSLKADHSIVTEADLAADGLIARAIHSEFPGDLILSEELQPTFIDHPSTASSVAAAGRLSPAGSLAQPIWIIDPLDGTTNFSLGLPFWGISIARVVDGEVDLGVIYFPKLDELYTASRGEGASLNDRPIHTQVPDPGQPTTFFTCCSRTYRRYQIDIPYKARILGSASYSFCSVARGVAAVAFEATPKIWDLAAVWLLVQEAGGTIETFDHSSLFPILPGVEYARRSFPTLAAASAGLAARSRQQIQPRQRA